MSGFYKMDPAAWDFGTAELSLEEEAAYLRIVNAIHKHDGPVPDIDRILAGLFRTSTRKARSLVDALVKAGKLVIEDGKIWNDRARSDMVRRGFVSVSRSESGAKGGRTRVELAAKSLENNKQAQANAYAKEENRIEEKRDTDVSPKDVGSKPKPKQADEAFERFWSVYPSKGRVGKKAAADKFRIAIRNGVDPDRIVSAASNYSRSDNVLRGYAKNALTWLNQGCWDDDIGIPANHSQQETFWAGSKVYT